MRAPTAGEVAHGLWRSATGKEPEAGPAWDTFVKAVVLAVDEIRTGAIVEAHSAVYSYQPIDPQDMQAAYRRGYETTKSAIGALVLDLNRARK